MKAYVESDPGGWVGKWGEGRDQGGNRYLTTWRTIIYWILYWISRQRGMWWSCAPLPMPGSTTWHLTDEINFEGLDLDDMHQLFINSGQEAVIVNITYWLEVYVHGVRNTGNEEILASVQATRGQSPPPEGMSEEDVQERPMKKLSAVRAYFDGTINFLGETEIIRLMPYALDSHWKDPESNYRETIHHQRLHQASINLWPVDYPQPCKPKLWTIDKHCQQLTPPHKWRWYGNVFTATLLHPTSLILRSTHPSPLPYHTHDILSLWSGRSGWGQWWVIKMRGSDVRTLHAVLCRIMVPLLWYHHLPSSATANELVRS